MIILKFTWKGKRTKIAKTIKLEDSHYTICKTYSKAIVIKIV